MNASEQIRSWRERGRPLAVPGADTMIWRQGTGEPVVCLHGVPASAFLYRKVLPELSALQLECIALDLPGLGLAARPADFDYRWSGLAAWFVRAMDAAGLDRFHLVVHDIGGPIGFEVVRRVPERIKSLTVLNTMVNVSRFHRPWSMEPFAWPRLGPLWLQSARTPLFFALLRLQGMYRISPGEAAAYGKLLLGDDQGRAFLKIMQGFERTEDYERGIKAALAARTFPAQVLWGRDDPALPYRRYAADLVTALGGASFHLLPGKHFLQEDAFGEIARHVANLVRGAV